MNGVSLNEMGILVRKRIIFEGVIQQVSELKRFFNPGLNGI